jgi:hypothetical protein
MAGKMNRQEQAISALLSEPTVEKAAAQAGVSYRTLKSWLAQPEFQVRYRAARAAVLERTVARLLHACGAAVAALEKNLGAENPQAANRAALGILDHALRGVEVLDLAERITALEAFAMSRHSDEAPSPAG